ncbi:iron complex outermembrane recepter protein [Paracoccus isoporae]|uniref:Iron complex outermembrane recepter protein n=1 Tax=Paracoccus isoporae TaxID=591205 RepID=A0A1G6WZW8_9RHOB|nr:TonB-dependent siderophore receptor [Paracoccus isoporae]SDD71391.1 iron complex outermembrane recepter protein [Paracoccus isoporae]
MPAHPRQILLLAGVSTAALAAAAAAQDPAVTPAGQGAENPVFVLGTIYLDAEDVAGYVASGAQVAKSLTPLAESQKSVSVVTEAQIDDQGASNLGESLGYTAGIYGQPFGADPRFNAPTLRGFESDKAQYVNGLRQGRFFGAVDYELYGMQQVEVLRGPSSSLYGAGMPAGIINQVQKRAQTGDFGEAGVGIDSHDGKRVFFDVNREASEALSWRLTGIGKDMQTQIDELGNERGYLAGAVRWSPDALTTIDLLASYTADAPISPVGIPFGLTELADGEDLRELYVGQTNWDDSDRKMWNLGVEVSHDLDSGWTLSQGFRYEKLDWDYTGTYVSTGAVIDADGSFFRGASRQSEESESVSLDTRLTGEAVTGQATHQLLFGMDLRRYEAEESSLIESDRTRFDWNDPDNQGPLPVFAGGPNSGAVTLRQVGIYAQDEVMLGNWRMTGGLRYDWAEQSGVQYNVPAEFDETKLTGQASLGYQFGNGVLTYLSYATSFDPQTGINENEEPLKPTEGEQWELGLKYQPTAFDGLFTAAIYDLTQTNVNQWAGSSASGVNLYRQIGEVRSRGLELEASAALSAAWEIRASYAYNDTEQRGGTNTGQPMWNAPKHSAGIWLDHDFGNGLRSGGGIRHIGSRMDISNTRELDSVTLLDMGASYTRGNLEGSLNVSNLTDEVYLSTCGWFGCYYGEGRTLSAKMTYTW